MISFAGDGWGAVAALKSLQVKFDVIEVCSDDHDVLALIRFSDKKINSLSLSESELVVCAGYKAFITKKELSKKCFINVHYSLLPKYRGMHSVVWAVLNGENRFGLSVYIMDEYMDNGDILAQFEFCGQGMNSTMIMTKCNELVECHLNDVISKYIDGEITPCVQDKSQATWVPKRNLQDCIIDYSENIQQIERLFLALVTPYPLPMIKINNDLYEITSFDTRKTEYFTSIGRVVNIDEEGAWIKVADGILLVKGLSLNGQPVDIYKTLNIGKRL
jgi:methionyl-tRNA formyltransferase